MTDHPWTVLPEVPAGVVRGSAECWPLRRPGLVRRDTDLPRDLPGTPPWGYVLPGTAGRACCRCCIQACLRGCSRWLRWCRFGFPGAGWSPPLVVVGFVLRLVAVFAAGLVVFVELLAEFVDLVADGVGYLRGCCVVGFGC